MDTNKQMNPPLVSILMLAYNRAPFLSEAISSVLSQTYQNFELVIIDDGSTDNTAEIISNFSDQRIKYVRHTENAGLFTRRKESLSFVTGEYVAVIDSDDVWIDSNKLANQVTAMENDSSLTVVGTQTRLIDKDNRVLGDYYYSTNDREIRKKILFRNQFTHSAVLMRTSAIVKTEGYQPTLAEDLDLFLQLGLLGTFSNLPIVATAHRVHEGSENDHGIKMSTAVLSIIKKRHQGYPNYFCAKLICQLRVLKHLILNYFK